LDRYRFNEAYLMHASTSPQYSIIASCDIAAAMMDAARSGTALTEESLIEAMDFRHAMRKAEAEYAAHCNTWWFSVWGPEHLPSNGIGRSGKLAGQGRATIGTASAHIEPEHEYARPHQNHGDDAWSEYGAARLKRRGFLRRLWRNTYADYGIIIDKVGLVLLLS
jgi:arginine decarboxylase